MTLSWHHRQPLLFFFLFAALSCTAQDLGGLSGNLDWQIIRSGYVNVITTPASEIFARRTQTLDEALIELQPLSLGGRLQEIDIVIQNETAISNGFVGLEPFRSYSFTSPQQQQALLSTSDWVDLLSIHEFRHVEQFTNLRRGGTKFASFVFGQGGWSAVMGLTVPNWFSEGDAVVSETALTYGGRGRTPAFTALQRAIALSGKLYAYPKARNGSFRSRVPDHYPLGYALTMHGWISNENLWPEVVKGTGNAWPPFYPFSLSLKQQTGKNTRDYYKMVYDSLATVWQAELAATKLSLHSPIPVIPKQLDIYSNPIPLPHTQEKQVYENGEFFYRASALLAERSNQVNFRELVRISPEGEVTSIAGQGVTIDGSMHAVGGKAVWTQLRNHPRRPNQTYNDIFCLDLSTNQKNRLTDKARYFNPGLNSDGSRLVAVEKIPQDPARLIILSSGDGRILHTIDESLTSSFDLLIGPRFTPDDQAIVAIAKRKDVLAIFRFDLGQDGVSLTTSQQITPWTRHVIGTPFVHDQHVYFSASFTGIDNIFRVRLDGEGGIKQLTSAAVSATQPSVDDHILYFVEVTAKGNSISRLRKELWLDRPITIVEPVDMPRYAALEFDGAAKTFRDRFYERDISQALEKEQPLNRREVLWSNEAAPKPYKGLLRGFRYYTFQPLANQNQVSGSIFGSNKLNDVSSQITVGRNLNERRNYVNANVILARTWPWITGSFSSASRNTIHLATQDSVRLLRTRFIENRVGCRLDAPFSQEYGANTLRFRPYLGAEYLSFTSVSEGEFSNLPAIGTADIGFRFTRLQQAGPKQILPRGGQLLNARLRQSLFGAREPVQQFTATAGVLLPGFTRSHSLLIRAHARVEAITNYYQFADFHSYARGYSRVPNSSALGAALDYHFPIVYPDVGAFGLIYVRRVRANVWGDLTRLQLPTQFRAQEDLLASVGLDLTVDATFFNVQDLPVGVRFAYRLQEDNFGVNPIGLVTPQLLFELPL